MVGKKSGVQSSVFNELEQARSKLLDRTLNNKLLNFRVKSKVAIPVIEEVPREVYGRLVLDSKSMVFRGKPSRNQDDNPGVDNEGNEPPESEEKNGAKQDLWKLDDEQLGKQHTDKFLETSLTQLELNKRLFKIFHKANEFMEEQGYNVLYLALAFLEWKQKEDEERTYLAPLILVPIELKRHTAGKSYSLKWSGEEVFTNVSLAARLKEDFGIMIPEFSMPDDKSGVKEYIDKVSRAIKTKNSWRVTSDIWLGFFSFARFVMWRDLAGKSWPEGNKPENCNLLAQLFLMVDREPEQLDQGDDEALVSRLDIRSVSHVMDADASQVAVIEHAKAGKNMVVEGPPGTGKSQTITNLIAELLASGKKVLFVSEKMAALDVVYRRLKNCSLADACLELHSHKTNKKLFYEGINRTISKGRPGQPQLESEYQRHAQLKEELDGYAFALGRKYGKKGISAFDLFGMREESNAYFRDKQTEAPRIKFKLADEWPDEEFELARIQLKNIAELLPELQPIKDNPWFACSPVVITQSDDLDLLDQIGEAKNATKQVQLVIQELSDITGATKALNMAEVATMRDAVGIMASAHCAKQALFERKQGAGELSTNDVLQRLSLLNQHLVDDILQRTTGTQEARRALASKLNPEVLDCNVAGLLDEFNQLRVGLPHFFKLSYWKTRNHILSFYKGKQKLSDDDLAADLQNVIDSQKLKAKLYELENIAQKVCGILWQGLETDCGKLSRALRWMLKFEAGLAKGSIKHEAVQLIQAGISAGQVKELLGKLDEAGNVFDQQVEKLTTSLALDITAQFDSKKPDITWTDWNLQFDNWTGASDRLSLWARWCGMRRDLGATRAEPMVELIEADLLSPDDVIPAFKGNFAEALLGVVLRSAPELKNFVTEVHEGRIKDFREVDENLLVQTQKKLARELWDSYSHQVHGASPGSEMGTLQRQLTRKRGLMPIRVLLEKCGELLQRIKPCFMMSPMSIAQYIKPGSVDFEVVIFDEASQVKPQDALGAILRGKQLIVMGDSRQLPPTSFFDRLGSEEEDDQDGEPQTDIKGVESILGLCKNNFPTKNLTWHYRSKHESLIAFSNQHFYENRMLVYPSAFVKHPDQGLELRYLPDTVYDRSFSATNKKEAEAVVRAVIEHYQKYNWDETIAPSLGIGTFSTKQQGVIQKLLSDAEGEYENLSKFRNRELKEPLFVKNLETIQGDERDVIFISIGYGKDVNGKLYQGFGPLNPEGGERRLNVLITRARQKCVVFSNFKESELLRSENANPRVETLRAFLKYAETGILETQETEGGEFDSPFEEAVFNFLREHGFRVIKQVGCAGYRIDLGVLHPERAGEYMLGVECDGASYHSTLVARDRDRLREKVIVSKDWRIHRIWSTDWYRSRVASEKRLLVALADARLASDEKLENRELAKAEVYTPYNIERDDEGLPEEEQTRNDVPHYEKCVNIDVPPGLKLVDCRSSHLATLVTKVVKVEAPIHFDDVVTRLRMAWGYGRAGNPIRDAISDALDVAIQNQEVIRRRGFLWIEGQEDVEPRKRNGDGLKIELICEEEIAAALLKVIEYQHATPDDELIKAAAKMLGYQAVRSSVAQRIDSVLSHQIDSGKLSIDSSKMVSIKGG